MTLLDAGSNYVWVPICFMALALIVWDMRESSHRRLLLAVCVAMMLGSAGIYAAQVPDWDVCARCPFMDSFMWWANFCFLC